MAWKTVTIGDVLSEFTVQEQAALKGIQEASEQLPAILTRVINATRGAIRSGGYALGEEGTTPDELDLEIIAIARWRWLIAFPQLQRMQTRDRKEAHDQAMARLDRIARQERAVEPPEEAGGSAAENPKAGRWGSEEKLPTRW